MSKQASWTDRQAETVGAELARVCDALDETAERFGDHADPVRVRASLRKVIRQAEKALLATELAKVAPKRKAAEAKPTTGAPALDNLLLAMLPAETPKATKIVPTKRVAAAKPGAKRRKPAKVAAKVAKRSLKGRVVAGDGTWIDPVAVSADGRYRRHGSVRLASGRLMAVRLGLAVDTARIAAKVKRPGEAPVFGHVMSDGSGFTFEAIAVAA